MSGILEFIRWQDFIDIIVIAFIVYRLLLLLMDTRAMQLVKGLFVIGLFYATARFLKLAALTWILGRLLGVFILAIPIVFQPEIRRMLEELGRGSIWRRRQAEERASQLTEEITRAILFLQSRKMGAILVFQKDTGLKDIWRSAVQIEGDVSQDLIISIFWPGNPLHDGAVILTTVIAAARYLPSRRTATYQGGSVPGIGRPLVFRRSPTPWPLSCRKSGGKWLWPSTVIFRGN